MEFSARTGAQSLKSTFASQEAHAATLTADTEPRYLKIFLLATPDNHRSPPLV